MNRTNLGKLTKGRTVSIVTGFNGSYITKYNSHIEAETRITRVDENGQEWVKVDGEYWKYPEQVEL